MRLAESGADEEILQAMRVVKTNANVLITSKSLSHIAIQTLTDNNVLFLSSQ